MGRLLARSAMMLFSRQPAIARIAFDIIVIQWRNKASPLARPINIGMSEKDSSSIAGSFYSTVGFSVLMRMFLNWTFIGGPGCIWRAMMPRLAAGVTR